MYALNVDKESGRILSATYHKFSTKDSVLVESLPEGDISDYRHIDGEFVFDPLIKVTEQEPPLSEIDRIAELEEAIELLLSGVTE